MAVAKIGKERTRYLKDFPKRKREKALKFAIQVRRLEYELYWKRASFGLTLIGVTFAGYFALQKDGGSVAKFAVTCLGLLASIAWFSINRGSAAFLRNWEIHVEVLEDEIIGPLFKRVIGRCSFSFFELIKPYPNSPQRINNIVALALVSIWSLLSIWTVLNASIVQRIVATHLGNAGNRALSVVSFKALLQNAWNAPWSFQSTINVLIVILLSIVLLVFAIWILFAKTLVPKNYPVQMKFEDRDFSDAPRHPPSAPRFNLAGRLCASIRRPVRKRSAQRPP